MRTVALGMLGAGLTMDTGQNHAESSPAIHFQYAMRSR